MKKSLTLLLALAIAVLPLAAEDYSAVMYKAREQSRSLQNAELSYQNASRTVPEPEKELGVTLSMQVTPVSSRAGKAAVPGQEPAADQFSVDKLSAQFRLPDDGGTTITLSSPLSIGYDGRFSMNPSLSASHTFSSSPEKDTRVSDIEETIGTLNTAKTRALADFSYDRSVINMMKQILSNEKSIEAQEWSLMKQERQLGEQVALGKVGEGSIQYERTHMNIEKAERTLRNLNDQHAVLMKKWKELTGLEWTGIENIPEYALRVERLPSGNTDVLIAALRRDQAEIRLGQLGAEEGISRSVSVSGDIGGSLRHPAAGGITGSFDTSLSVNYQDPTWKANASISMGGSALSDMRPTVTVGGSWSTGPKPRTAPDAAVPGSRDRDRESLENELVQKENALADAFMNYSDKADEIEGKMEDHLWDMKDHENQLAYLESELEFEKALYEEGLSTERDIEEAEHNLEMERLNGDLLRLDGVLLAYESAQFAL